MSNKLIRNSTAEFLIFTGQSGEQSIEARYEDESIWLTQKLMTQTELQEHRDTMRNLNTDAERAQYPQQHHKRMLQRARENGVEPKNGMGQGSGKGMGNGQGKGSGGQSGGNQ